MIVGYIVSEYPKVSHSFIRREILALEAAGVRIERFAVRGSSENLPDPQDRAEAQKTTYVLSAGIGRMLLAILRWLLQKPGALVSALRLATRMARGADRPLQIHWVYLAEAALVAEWAVDRKVTHLHAHFGSNPAEVAMLASTLSGIPYSFTAHGTAETNNPLGVGLPEKIRRAAFVVAVSRYGRAQMMRWVDPSHWERIHVVHCGLGSDFIGAAVPPRVDSPVFLTVGRLSPEKGQMVLLEAASLLAQAGTKVQILLAGDGDLRGRLEERCRQLGLCEQVRILGWVSSQDVRDLLAASRALVLPSFSEGLPVVLMEALALGRPVIATWIAGVPELVKHEQNGWLVPPGDANALAAAIKDCLDSARPTLDAMGRDGKAMVERQHASSKQAQALLRLFVRVQKLDPA